MKTPAQVIRFLFALFLLPTVLPASDPVPEPGGCEEFRELYKLPLLDIDPDTYRVPIEKAREVKEELKESFRKNLPQNLQFVGVGLGSFGKGFTVEVRTGEPIPIGYSRFFPVEKDGVLIRTRYTGRIARLPEYIGDYRFIQRAAEGLERELTTQQLKGTVEITYPDEAFFKDALNDEMDVHALKKKYPTGFELNLHLDSPLTTESPEFLKLPVFFFQGVPVTMKKIFH